MYLTYLIHCGLLLMFLSCARTKEYVYDYGLENAVTTVEQRYSLWPSVHNALMLRKREVKQSSSLSEGGGVVDNHQAVSPPATAAPVPDEVNKQPELAKPKDKVEIEKPQPTVTNETLATASTNNETSTNTTAAVASPKQLDLHNPGVLMRGIIVFGGFLLLAVVYYIFYKTKGNKNETGNSHTTNDTNQFRYGVLHSEDRRDNLELSRVPLTMESDDDEDEDLEIFDLGQKKQSLSYVNLQTNDEDIVFQKSTESGSNDKDNLLLDIEDVNTDPLINWTNNGNKSIL